MAPPVTAASAPAGSASAASAVVAAPAPAPAPDAIPTFDILEYVIEGNTVLSVVDIERAVTPYLGEGKTLREVEGARKALEEAYQSRGYQTVFVDVPEQRVTGGEIRLNVLEGKVDRLRVVGSRYFSLGEIRAAVPALAEGSVPDFNEMQVQLAAVNRVADRQVNPVLRPGTAPGTVEVDLAVKDQRPLHGEIELNNRSSAFTSESRLSAGIHWDNLWQRQHSAGLTLQVSPEAQDEVRLLVGNYLWRFADRPDVIALFAARSDSQVALVGSSLIQGKATILGARWVKPLSAPAGANLFHSLTFGIDHKDVGQTNVAVATDTAEVLPALAYAPVSLAYSLTRALPGLSDTVNLSFTTAPSGLLGNSDDEFKGRRVLARAGWLALRADLTHEQTLNPRLGLWTKAELLWSPSPLISNEQFILGGAESVRGYREGELAGDRGGRLSAELRWWPWRAVPATPATAAATATAVTAPAEPNGLAAALPALQLYTLFDIGGLQTDQPAGTATTRRWIGGLGAGLRWNSASGWRAQIEAARALNPGGGGTGGRPITDTGDWRLHLRLGHDF